MLKRKMENIYFGVDENFCIYLSIKIFVFN